ncbi:hypothetical protein CYLTODRAFT_416769 [Cylindrobasidium torrendii FP15055 ss-10]|uniref:Zn(2)-C6 fungal-type domain-containing protein n=1 Tax=Cylindrobasidium torrendii FP15055 ss-10 TaxID=1314674 RepID=A0A0D7BVV5_9AGAR|nr:hypothetical protein CYLTODRAFT_416769 [Cylindrobasidium torrendii FP15055 ss-10]
MSKTCTACRSRKVRCDGVQPTCGSCARSRKALQCVFADPSPTNKDFLSRGAACVPCRRKKKRCNGRRPVCDTCTASGDEGGCIYDCQLFYLSKSELIDRIFELEAQLQVYQNAPSPPSDSGSSSSDEHSTASPVFDQEQDSTSPSQQALVPQGVARSIPPAVDFTPLRTLLLGTFRAHFGLCLPHDKMAMIVAGNSSPKSPIHPILIYAARLWSSMVRQDIDGPTASPQTSELQNSIDSVKNTSFTLDPNTALQGLCLVAKYYIVKGDVYQAREYLLKGAHVLIRFDMHLVIATVALRKDSLSAGPTMSVSTNADVGAICQLLYMDFCQHLLFSMGHVVAHKYFDELMTISRFYTFLDLDVFCIVARTVSAMYHHRSKELLAKLGGGIICCGTRTAEWNTEYSALVVDMQAHLDNIKLRMIEVNMSHDQQNEQSLKTAELVVLAALTELAYAFAQTDIDSRRTAIHLANEMILIIDSFSEGDYPHLDGCVSLAFNACLHVYQMEIGSLASMISAEQVSFAVEVLSRNIRAFKHYIYYMTGEVLNQLDLLISAFPYRLLEV